MVFPSANEEPKYHWPPTSVDTLRIERTGNTLQGQKLASPSNHSRLEGGPLFLFHHLDSLDVGGAHSLLFLPPFTVILQLGCLSHIDTEGGKSGTIWAFNWFWSAATRSIEEETSIERGR